MVIHITACLFHLMAFVSLEENPTTHVLQPANPDSESNRWLGRTTWIEDAYLLDSKPQERYLVALYCARLDSWPAMSESDLPAMTPQACALHPPLRRLRRRRTAVRCAGACTTLSTTGYGDITPGTYAEIVFAMCAMLGTPPHRFCARGWMGSVSSQARGRAA